MRAHLYLVGVKVAETCVGWERNGNRLTAKIDFVTVNVGIWKLEKPTVKFEHDLDTNSGKVLFSGKLFKLEELPPDYKLKKEWTDHTIGSW